MTDQVEELEPDAPAETARYVWAVTDHVCLNCFGRVLERCDAKFGVFASGRVFRCSNCGVEAVGAQRGAPPICACRAKLGKRDAGIRCVANPRPRPELPSEFIAKEVA